MHHMIYKISMILIALLLAACESPAAPTFVVPIPTNPTTNTPHPTPEPTYTTFATPTKVVPSATPTRLPPLPLPTLDPSATAPAVFFLQVDVPAGVGWGWVANICGLTYSDWPIVDAFNSDDGLLTSGVQSIACPYYRKD